MGRTLKRVPLDFDWPIGEVWRGYINPHYEECTACLGSGSTLARLRLEDLVSLMMLSGADSLKGSNHPYFESNWAFHHQVIPSPDMAELTTGLSGRSPAGHLGHDAIDRWEATAKIIKAAGLDDETWGICLQCDGHGCAPENLEAWESWEPKEPPAGEGFQLWGTTNEGEPISPVFDTLEKLCKWAAENATTFASFTATKEEWMDMLESGFIRHEEGNLVFM